MQQLLICINQRISADSCAARGAKDIAEALQQAIDQQKLAIQLQQIQCFGRCQDGVNVRWAGHQFWHHVTLDDIDAILETVVTGLC